MVKKIAGFLKYTLFMMLIVTLLAAGMCVNCVFAKTSSLNPEENSVEIVKVTITSISKAMFSAGFTEYNISKETEIIDTRERVIDLKKVAVPCEASVSFIDTENMKKALKVILTKFSYRPGSIDPE